MTNNDVLRSVRYMLDLSDAQIVKILALAESQVEEAEVHSFLKKDDDPAFRACPDVIMGYFLNGLIFQRRGKSEDAPAPSIERKMTNNIMMKKLRVAFDLKTTDIIDILKQVDFAVGPAEIGAIFRKPGHKNYRECGDQILRNFLKGLTKRVRPAVS
ncbi:MULTISPECIES: DUF1456 family protein [Erwinia]|uniref:DUF1456 family protein n=1 Tax=Erwinia TaxID=551 RepID=UPI000551AC8C|nr:MULTISPECIES: DUF1456 family protein [Erwinia]